MSNAQQKAELKRGRKRLGTPTFSAIRFSGEDKGVQLAKKTRIEEIIQSHGTNREEAIIAAFEALAKLNGYD